jgi:hypothetical protein
VTLHSGWKTAGRRRQVVEEFGAEEGGRQSLERFAQMRAAGR